MSKNKLPALQFYPGDWMRDLGIRALTLEERGAWFELLLLMHGSEERGKLILNGVALTDEQIGNMVGGLDNHVGNQKATTMISTFLKLGVASRCPTTGALINRRMVRDEELLKIRRASGKLGGNPLLKKGRGNLVNQNSNHPDNHPDNPPDNHPGNHPDNPPDNHPANQKPTPSFSFSTSVENHARAREPRATNRAKPNGQTPHVDEPTGPGPPPEPRIGESMEAYTARIRMTRK